MLELTIIKERHETEGEAKKLLPYIEKCDIYGIENANCSISDAIDMETQWRDRSLKRASRTEFMNVRQSVYRGASKDFALYGLKRDDYLFRMQKPLWIAERFADNESVTLKEKMAESFLAADLTLGFLEAKKIEEFSSLFLEEVVTMFENMQIRDRNIAKNIEGAEKYVREFWPSLASVEKIKLVLGIGAMHAPEDFLARPYNVVDLYGPLPLQAELQFKMQDTWKKSGQVARRDLLAYGVTLLQNKGNIGLEVSSQEIRNLDFDELVQKLK
jgi:hypothetical protein